MWTGYRTLDRHVLRRRLPARLRRRRGWRPGLHRVRYRVPQANHRRQKGGRRSAAADPIDEIELLRCSPHADCSGASRRAACYATGGNDNRRRSPTPRDRRRESVTAEAAALAAPAAKTKRAAQLGAVAGYVWSGALLA